MLIVLFLAKLQIFIHRLGSIYVETSVDISHHYKAIIGNFRRAQPALKQVKDPNKKVSVGKMMKHLVLSLLDHLLVLGKMKLELGRIQGAVRPLDHKGQVNTSISRWNYICGIGATGEIGSR